MRMPMDKKVNINTRYLEVSPEREGAGSARRAKTNTQ